MIVITGGAFQGKLDVAKAKFGVSDSDVYFCDESGLSTELDLSKKVICGLEQYSLACVRAGILPDETIQSLDLGDKILIATDISCGIVPMDKTERAWREANGRMMTALALSADEVYRVFCGIAKRFK